MLTKTGETEDVRATYCALPERAPFVSTSGGDLAQKRKERGKARDKRARQETGAPEDIDQERPRRSAFDVGATTSKERTYVKEGRGEEGDGGKHFPKREALGPRKKKWCEKSCWGDGQRTSSTHARAGKRARNRRSRHKNQKI